MGHFGPWGRRRRGVSSLGTSIQWQQLEDPADAHLAKRLLAHLRADVDAKDIALDRVGADGEDVGVVGQAALRGACAGRWCCCSCSCSSCCGSTAVFCSGACPALCATFVATLCPSHGRGKRVARRKRMGRRTSPCAITIRRAAVRHGQGEVVLVLSATSLSLGPPFGR